MAVERKPVKRPRQNDDSSEDDVNDDDDDMDGFIDDGSDAERTDYSAYIRQLFGYDRRKLVSFTVIMTVICKRYMSNIL